MSSACSCALNRIVVLHLIHRRLVFMHHAMVQWRHCQPRQVFMHHTMVQWRVCSSVSQPTARSGCDKGGHHHLFLFRPKCDPHAVMKHCHNVLSGGTFSLHKAHYSGISNSSVPGRANQW
jgi:hypothetical protein